MVSPGDAAPSQATPTGHSVDCEYISPPLVGRGIRADQQSSAPAAVRYAVSGPHGYYLQAGSSPRELLHVSSGMARKIRNGPSTNRESGCSKDFDAVISVLPRCAHCGGNITQSWDVMSLPARSGEAIYICMLCGRDGEDVVRDLRIKAQKLQQKKIEHDRVKQLATPQPVSASDKHTSAIFECGFESGKLGNAGQPWDTVDAPTDHNIRNNISIYLRDLPRHTQPPPKITYCAKNLHIKTFLNTIQIRGHREKCLDCIIEGNRRKIWSRRVETKRYNPEKEEY